VGLEEAAGVNDILDSFTFIGDNSSLLLDKALAQLWISALALMISLVIAVPIGVWLGHIHRGSFAAINISNVGRALPSLAVIAVAIAPLGLGRGTLLLALVVLAVPPILTNAYAAVDSVDRDVVDAARGMGLRERDILFGTELPLALPLLFGGIRTAAVYIVATVPLGALVGTEGGLGEIIANQASYRLPGVIAAAICVGLVALLVDLVFAVLQRAVTPRGLRRDIDFSAVQTAAGSKQPQEITA
jgi:osmoprotectant transport system permease protein